MLGEAPVKTGNKTINVCIPNVTKGDKVITFSSDTPEAREHMAAELMNIRKSGQLLSLYRGKKKDLVQIFGYDPKAHSWILGGKGKTALREPVGAKDEIHVIVPQSGG